jgi:hypothetical protein
MAGLSLCVLLLASAPARSRSVDPSDFAQIATHPDAQLQGTALGRTISHITPFSGKLYFGYGDWRTDTGPINIRSLDPATATWSESLLTFGTEAIAHYRQLGGRLYAPNIDPLGTPGVNPGGFALGTPDGTLSTWTQEDRVAATHVLDITSFQDDSQLWMVGSVDTTGAVWTSSDGGATFSVARTDGPAAGSPDFAFSRYEGIGSFGNKLYIQRRDLNAAQVTSSLVYDGSSWSTGPDLVPGLGGFLWRPTLFLDELVYLNNDREPASLFQFDGTQARVTLSSVRDFFADDEDGLYALTESDELYVTSDLDTWTLLGTAPNTARSLAVWDGELYLGTTESTILAVSIPEPSSAFDVCAAALTGLGLCRRSIRPLAR